MATVKATKLDAQGRVMLPPHIRKELNLNPGQILNVTLEDGTIKVRPEEERCVFCGEKATDKYVIGPKETRICRSCSNAITYATQNKEEVK